VTFDLVRFLLQIYPYMAWQFHGEVNNMRAASHFFNHSMSLGIPSQLSLHELCEVEPQGEGVCK
jgi:hypothetical protein